MVVLMPLSKRRGAHRVMCRLNILSVIIYNHVGKISFIHLSTEFV